MHVAKHTCQTGIKLNKMPLQTFTHIPLMLRTTQKILTYFLYFVDMLTIFQICT